MATKKQNLLTKTVRFSVWQAILIAAVVGGLGLYVILGALAAPPRQPLSASLILAPNPVAAGQRVDVSGCGYDNKPVHIKVSDGTQYGVGVWADGGCIQGYMNAPAAGNYTVEAYQDGKGKNRILMATSTLIVQ